MSGDSGIRHNIDSEGVATMTWEGAGCGVRLSKPGFGGDFAAAIERLIGDSSVRGVILAGGAASFMTGMAPPAGQGAGDEGPAAQAAYHEAMTRHALLRRLETGGKPFVAAIGGPALGEGLQLCLACHHRLVGDRQSILLGLPESRVRSMPSLGGTQRLPRLIGTRKSLPLLLDGVLLPPGAAVESGLAHGIVPPDELVTRARSWIIGGGAAGQPWDAGGFAIPGGTPHASSSGQLFTRLVARLRARGEENLAHGSAILSAVYEGTSVPLDAALRIEARYHAWLVSLPGQPEHGDRAPVDAARRDWLERLAPA